MGWLRYLPPRGPTSVRVWLLGTHHEATGKRAVLPTARRSSGVRRSLECGRQGVLEPLCPALTPSSPRTAQARTAGDRRWQLPRVPRSGRAER